MTILGAEGAYITQQISISASVLLSRDAPMWMIERQHHKPFYCNSIKTMIGEFKWYANSSIRHSRWRSLWSFIHCLSSEVNPVMQCAWWRRQMEIFSTLPAICEGNPPVTDGFLSQSPGTRSFDVFFDLHLNKRLSTQSRHWWFEMPSRSLWRHCNVCRYEHIVHCLYSYIES